MSGNKSDDANSKKLIDNRKVGVFFFVVAAIVIGVSLFIRISDVRKSAGYKHVDGVVSSIDTKRTFFARKYRYRTTVSVLYSPEGSDINSFVSYDGFVSYFLQEGDIIRVYYNESKPWEAYAAEKDWLTGGYIHAGRGYNMPLIIGAIILLFGVIFFEDGVKAAKKAKKGKDKNAGKLDDPATPKKIGLGDIVTVTVDRPLGSYHPEHKDMYYPVNYGYIAGVIAEDGEEQDAYILGVDGPVKEFTGEVIGIVYRDDDVETKLVVAPQNSSFTSDEIMSQINFTEKYYKSHLVVTDSAKSKKSLIT